MLKKSSSLKSTHCLKIAFKAGKSLIYSLKNINSLGGGCYSVTVSETPRNGKVDMLQMFLIGPEIQSTTSY